MESVSQIMATKRARSEHYKNTVGLTPSDKIPAEWSQLKDKVNSLSDNYPEYFKTRNVYETTVGDKKRYEVEVEAGQINGDSYVINLDVYEKTGVAIQVWYMGFLSSFGGCYRRKLVDIGEGDSTVL